MSPSDYVPGPQDHPSQLFDIPFNGGLAEARAIADQDKDSDSSHHVRAFNSGEPCKSPGRQASLKPCDDHSTSEASVRVLYTASLW